MASPGVSPVSYTHLTDLLPVEPEDTAVVGWSLYKTEKKEVIKGKSLDESPVFSCIIPSSFCPDNTYSTDKSGYELQDGVAYLGKTLTIEPIMDSYDMLYYYDAGDMGYTTKWYYFPALEYKVKVVGIFQAAYDLSLIHIWYGRREQELHQDYRRPYRYVRAGLLCI